MTFTDLRRKLLLTFSGLDFYNEQQNYYLPLWMNENTGLLIKAPHYKHYPVSHLRLVAGYNWSHKQ